MRKIYLVYAPNPVMGRMSFPMSLGFLAKALHLGGFDFEVIDLLPVKPDKRIETFKEKVSGIDNAIFGFGLIMGNNTLKTCEKYAGVIKEHSENHTVIYGGPLPTAVPQMILENCHCDYVVCGEGEKRLPALLLALEKGSDTVEGVYSKGNIPHELRRPVIQKIKDLDYYSPPYYDAFDFDFYIDFYKENDMALEIMASRGCWAQCDFCFKSIGSGFHSRSAESILDEIEYLHERCLANKFMMRGENFLMNKKVVSDLIKGREKRGLDFRFRCSARIDDINDELLDGLAGIVISIGMGIESLNQESLDSVKKRTNVSGMERTINMIRKRGIDPRGAFIIGLPTDTEKDYEAVYDFIERAGLKGGGVNYLTPTPGTKLYNDTRDLVLTKTGCKNDWEYIKLLDSHYLFQELVVNLSPFPDDVLKYHKNRIHKRLRSMHEKISDKYQEWVNTDVIAWIED